MNGLQLRQQQQNPNLWWVTSSSGEDVAYIAHPGDGYLACTTDKWKSAPAEFVGKRFESVDAALEAVAKSIA